MQKKVKKSTRKKVQVMRSSTGLGLFAGEFIKKGERIIEYIGEIISNDEADKRGGKYLFELSSRRILDGKNRKNIARYINHSCRPNCDTDIIGGRVLVIARRDIKEGEEFSYNYGKEYFNDHIKPYGCKCSKCVKKKV